MGGKSKSSTASTTQNKTNNIQTESGFQIVDSAGASIIATDHDAIELSFDAIEEVSRDSLDFAKDFGGDALDVVGNVARDSINNADRINTRSFDFATDALEQVGESSERVDFINSRATGTIKDFANDAIESVSDANERVGAINNKSIDTIKNFAETLKVGDLKTTQTIYLAGAGLIAAIVVSAVVIVSVSKVKAAGK